MKQTKAYGFWPSNLSARQVATSKGQRSELRYANDRLFFLERRPEEQGRGQIVSVPATRQAGDNENTHAQQQDHLPDGVSAASSVHEYGGAAFTVSATALYFVNAKDQQIYAQSVDMPESNLQQITDAPAYRFADLQVDGAHNRLIAVAEIAIEDQLLPDNALVSISLDQHNFGEIITLHESHDFYAAPRLSADSQQLAFYSWDMPNMPWDQTCLYLADVEKTELRHLKALVDAPNQAPQQPYWYQGLLYFLNDPTGYWSLYRLDPKQPKQIQQICDHPGEIGLPAWVFGQQNYAMVADQVIFTAAEAGIWSLYTAKLPKLDAGNTSSDPAPATKVDMQACEFAFFTASESHVFVKTNYADKGGTIERLAFTNEMNEAANQSLKQTISATPMFTQSTPHYAVSLAEPISVDVGDASVTHAFYYPPAHDTVTGEAETSPPLIVIGHGGPSGQSTQSFNDQIQFWTSRGFAIADVNYRGSTGFGRDYREQLYGHWGLHEVADCVAVAEHLVSTGKADAEKLIIRGKSAGGYSVLAALSFTETFSLGAVYYGISDLTALAEDTHKFEYAYLDKLVAAYPDERQTYIDRSPLYHLDKLSAPVIVFQGLKDKVVPPEQAEAIVSALREKGIAVEYHTFAEEKHGFRQPENIVTAFESELAFYQQHLG